MSSSDALPPLPQLALGFYRHYKGGIYELLAIVRHSEDLSPMVLYKAHSSGTGLWVRPLEMWDTWIEDPTNPDAPGCRRFEFLGIHPPLTQV